jgi:hypothetical protein
MQNNLQWLRTTNRIHVAKKTYAGTSLSILHTVNAPIQKLTIDGASSQTVTTQGMNLFDKNKTPITIIANTIITAIESGIKVKNTVAGTYKYVLYELNVVPNEVLYFKGVWTNILGTAKIEFFNENNIEYLSSAISVNGSSVTVTPTTNKLRIRFYCTRGTSELGEIDYTVQLEKNAVTAYAPFVPDSPSPSYPATITNIVNPVLTVNSANLVQNGNFANGTTGWTSSNTSSFAVNNGIASTTGNDVGTSTYLIQTTNQNIIPNHKYYVRATMKMIDASSNAMVLKIRSSTGNGDSGDVVVQSNPIPNQSYTKSAVLTAGSTWSGFLQFRCSHYYLDSITKNGKTMEVQNVMVIDMGADNINPLYSLTTAQMDILFANWSDYKSTATNLLGTLRSLPNGVCDKIIIDRSTITAWIERNIGAITLNSGTSWNIANAKANSSYRSTNLASGNLTGTTLTSAVAVPTSFEVDYELATPTIESITFPSLESIQYLTNISTNSALNPTIKATVRVLGN